MNLLPNSFCFGRSKFLLCLAMVASTLLSRTQKLAGSGKGSRALFSPTVYLEVSTLLTDRIAVSISPEPDFLISSSQIDSSANITPTMLDYERKERNNI